MKDHKTQSWILLIALAAVVLTPCRLRGQGFFMSDQPILVVKCGNQNHAIAFSPDSCYMAVGGEGFFKNVITLVEMPSGNKIMEMVGHGGQINGLVFSPDGTRIISGSSDRTIRVWDVASGQQLAKLDDKQEIRGVACAGSGKLIAAGGTANNVTLWNGLEFFGMGQLQQHVGPIQSVAMSPDGRFVASGSNDRNIKVWDLEQGGIVASLSGNWDEVTAVAFSPDNRRLAGGSEDEVVRQWLLPDFRGTATMSGHTNDILSLAYSPNGRYLASGSRDHDVMIWEVASGRMLQKRSIEQDPWALAFSPDGKLFAVGTSDKGVLVYRLEGIEPERGIIYAEKPVGPNIELIRPDSPTLSTTGPRIIVTGLVSDPEGITRVSVNGLDARLAEPTPEEAERLGGEQKVYRFIGEALLVLGENKIQIMAVDAQGNVNEKMIVVNRMIGMVGPDGTSELTQTSTIKRTEPPGAKIKIAVLDLDAQGVTPVVAQVLSESLRTELYNSGLFRVMNREDVDKVLKEKEFESTSVVESTEGIAKVGTALGVDKMVTGSIGKLGETYSVTLRMVNVATHENERIVTERYRGTEDDLFIAISAVARKLIAGY